MQIAAGEATRQIYWNVTHVWMMYPLFLPTVAVGAMGLAACGPVAAGASAGPLRSSETAIADAVNAGSGAGPYAA